MWGWQQLVYRKSVGQGLWIGLQIGLRLALGLFSLIPHVTSHAHTTRTQNVGIY